MHSHISPLSAKKHGPPELQGHDAREGAKKIKLLIFIAVVYFKKPPANVFEEKTMKNNESQVIKRGN